MLASCARVILAAFIVALLVTPRQARAQGDWLAGPLTPWNTPGMAVPGLPADVPTENLDYCAGSIRPPETAEDQAVTSQGWSLFSPYQSGWGVRVIGGTASFDGMCRPDGYQYFVFVNGVFAGTISPVPMFSRTTGAGRIDWLTGDRVSATFVRYTDRDPLCCPSGGNVTVDYQIIGDQMPVLVPAQKYEQPAGAS